MTACSHLAASCIEIEIEIEIEIFIGPNIIHTVYKVRHNEAQIH